MYYQKPLQLNDNQVTHMCFSMQINIKKVYIFKAWQTFIKTWCKMYFK